MVVDNWRGALKLWSVRLAVAAGVLAGVLAANPQPALDLLGMIPAGFDWLKPILAFGIVTGVPVIARLMKQEPKE
jgi:hypothetical protein